MLRALVVSLLVVNVAFFAWTQGWLDTLVGVRALGDREPERLAQQVHPERIRLLGPRAAVAAASRAQPKPACLEAGPFDAAALPAAEAALASVLPADAWTRSTVERPPRWILYVGRYASRESMQRREQEFARLQMPFEEVTGAPALEPGLSLGRFDSRDAAEQAQVQLQQRGFRGARVVQLGGATQHMLRVERAESDLSTRLAGLTLDAPRRRFEPCARP